MMDDDDWQEMPVVREAASSSSSDEGGGGAGSRRHRKVKNAFSAKKAYTHGRSNSGYTAAGQTGTTLSGATNATGRHLDIDDARGYSWRAKPEGLGDNGGLANVKDESKNAKKRQKKRRARRKRKPGEEKAEGETSSSSSESSSDSDKGADESGARGYTQLRLDDDPEAEDLNAATDYLFTGAAGAAGSTAIDEVDNPGATPHSQLNTTKNLLSEGQKIAYVGLVSLAARLIVRQLERVPGKELKPAIASAEEWRLRVIARLFQHMDIESGEQRMIESLAEHGVLMSDLAPSLITTQTVDNPDFDPEALLEKQEEEARIKQQEEDEEERRKLEEEEERIRQKYEDEQGRKRQVEEAARLREVGDYVAKSSTSSEGDIGHAGGDPSEGRFKELTREGERSGRSTPSSSLKDFDGGDLGDISSPRNEQNPFEDSLASNGVEVLLYQEHDEDGDLGAEARVSAQKKAGKEGRKHSPAKTGDEAPTVVDPNTATRLEAAPDAKLTPMGLTNQPQAIDTLPSALEGVTTELSSADKTITLDLRWTVLCDLFLVLTADSVYDSRSRVLLERVAEELGLTWMDVTKFEKRVTDALEIEEGVSGSLKGKKAVRKRAEMARRRRMVMMGLATVGGGLVIGLSAGLMAPLIGAGLGAALGTIGIGGTTSFLSGVGGAAIITSTGTIGGAALGGTGMSKRTRQVQTFEFKPLHNNKRVNCIIAVPGFMNGPQDDPRLPFSVVDSIMGDIFSLLWEPDMMQEMGNAIYLLWNETLVQGVQQILAATIAGGLVGALAWPLWLTKLGYFIDNPWSNALDRSHACGLILADVLAKRKIGVRPITLVGFSLGARVIFYALAELARTKKFGIVQNVYLIGAPVTANNKIWREARSVVAGRFVNAYSRTDWILGWLFRATTGGLGSIAGLRPVEKVPELENVDVTQTVPGHLQYRAFMPLVLDQLGFRTTADYFDEPEDINAIPEREVVYDVPDDRKLKTVQTKTGGFGRIFRRKGATTPSGSVTGETTPGDSTDDQPPRRSLALDADDDLPPREESPVSPPSPTPIDEMERSLAELAEHGIEVRELQSSLPPLITRIKSPSSSRRGSKLKESILPDSFEAHDDKVDVVEPPSVPAKDSLPGDTPVVTVSDMDAPHLNDDETGQPGSDVRSRASASYARRFGSTSFDADELPPPAPAVSGESQIDLSFGDSYEDTSFGDSTAKDAPGVMTSDYDAARLQYGLSPEAAKDLAKQFESSGMSTVGALAAARLAQNFEAMEVQDSDSSKDIRRPSLPSSVYSGMTAGSGSASNFGTSSFDADAWGSLQPSSNDITPVADRARASPSPKLDQAMIAAPQSTHAWNNENPWG